jgi:pyruvate ferredoxin oxidoreductase gamma subunit
VVVLDARLMNIVNVTSGLKEKGCLVINTSASPEEASAQFEGKFIVATINASTIAREELGVPIVNTTMIGALLKASGILEPEALVEPLKSRFGKIAQKNINAMNRAYRETRIKE